MTKTVGREYIGAIDPVTGEERLSDVEIVRCIDCVWFQEFPGTCGPKSACTLYPTFYHFTPEYGYCDNGVRKVRE